MSDPRDMPKVIGHATSIHGDHLTIFAPFDGVGESAFAEDGSGPYIRIGGCPNCGKHADEWWDGITYAGTLNSGWDPNKPCSRVCQYQLEWQAEIAARRLTEVPR